MSQEKKGRKSLFPQCKTSIGNNSGSIQDGAVKFACSMEFSDMADQMVRPRRHVFLLLLAVLIPGE